MNCQHCQRRLMSIEKPAYAEPLVAAHLTECASCREFQRLLLRVEANVRRVPVPPSRKKARFLERVRGQHVQALPGPLAAATPTPAGPPAAPPVPAARMRPRAWVALVAAAVVLVVFGLWLGNQVALFIMRPDGSSQHQAKADDPAPKGRPDPFKQPETKKTPDDVKAPPLVSRLLECDLKLAEAETPRQRVLALAELADVLQQETRDLSRSKKLPKEDFDKLAKLYKQVVHDGIVPRARELPMDDRRDLLQAVAQQLTKTHASAEQLAKTAPQAPAAEALRVIALAAHDGDAQLRGLMQQGGE